MDINKVISAISTTPQTGATSVQSINPAQRGAVGDPSFQAALTKFSQTNNPFADSNGALSFQGAFNKADGKLGDDAIQLAGGAVAGRKLFLTA